MLPPWNNIPVDSTLDHNNGWILSTLDHNKYVFRFSFFLSVFANPKRQDRISGCRKAASGGFSSMTPPVLIPADIYYDPNWIIYDIPLCSLYIIRAIKLSRLAPLDQLIAADPQIAALGNN